VGSFALGFLAEEGASVVLSDSTTRTRFLEAEEGAEESFEGVALAGVATLELFGVDLAIVELIEVVRVEIVENKFLIASKLKNTRLRGSHIPALDSSYFATDPNKLSLRFFRRFDIIDLNFVEKSNSSSSALKKQQEPARLPDYNRRGYTPSRSEERVIRAQPGPFSLHFFASFAKESSELLTSLPLRSGIGPN
jgi:hypothetical protein